MEIIAETGYDLTREVVECKTRTRKRRRTDKSNMSEDQLQKERIRKAEKQQRQRKRKIIDREARKEEARRAREYSRSIEPFRTYEDDKRMHS